MTWAARASFWLCLGVVAGCGSDPATDAGTATDAREALDARAQDAGVVPDAPGLDAQDLDAGPALDTGEARDAAAQDAPSAPDAFSPDAAPELCGNGAMDPGEVCDDGDREGGDGCRADCLGTEVCGDGLADVGEWCPASSVTIDSPRTGMFGNRPTPVDADADGDVDLYYTAIVGSESRLFVMRNDGTGAFAAAVDAGADVLGTFGDVEGTAAPEMISTTSTGVRVWPNRGDGTFGAPTELAHAAVATAGFVDLEGDGDLDIVTGTFTGTTCGVFVRDAGAYAAAADVTCGATALEHRFQLTGDLDGDGRGDVVFLHDLGMANVTVAHGRGDGTFDVTSVNSRFPTFGALGDVDGDGQLDVVHAVQMLPAAIMVVHTHGGAPDPGAELLRTSALGVFFQIVDADLDGDLDLYAFGATAGTPFVFLRENDGSGGFATDLDTSIPSGLQLVDLNGDRALDRLAADETSVHVTLAAP